LLHLWRAATRQQAQDRGRRDAQKVGPHQGDDDGADADRAPANTEATTSSPATVAPTVFDIAAFTVTIPTHMFSWSFSF
jgi:hypothetical protein